MDKCEDKFCPECGHHLYRQSATEFYCSFCSLDFDIEQVATLEEILPLRENYDSRTVEK